MKRLSAILLALVMLLALCACGGVSEEESRAIELYGKYAAIIDRLEAEDYNGVIQEIAVLANSGKEPEQSGSLGELLLGTWYADTDNSAKAPKTVTVGQGGSVTMDGETYTWLDQHEDDTYKGGFLLKDGVHTYLMEINKHASDMVPYVSLWTVEGSEGNFYGGSHLGSYYNDPMLIYLMASWQNLDGEDEVLDDYFSIWNSNANLNNTELDWSVTSSGEGTITADLGGQYTFTVELRGELPIGFLTETATGAQAAYYTSDNNLSYDRSWPEFIYPRAKAYLAECLEDLDKGNNPGFYDRTGEEGVDYYNNAAWKRLYELFTGLGDYKDSAELAARFTILKDMYVGASLLTVDNMGNESTSKDYETCGYNALGQVTSSYNLAENFRLYSSSGKLYFFYDEAGRLAKIQRGTDNNISFVLTPAYDDQGRMVSGAYQSNSGTREFTYRYDDQGRLVENIVWNGSDRYQYLYTYDDQGLLTKLVRWYGWSEPDYNTYRYTTDYTYDANGFLVEEVTVSEYNRSWEGTFSLERTMTYTYTNDAQGRPVSAQYSEVNKEGVSNYASQTITYKYEDLYFFN